MGLPTSSAICFLSSFHTWLTLSGKGLLRSLWSNLGLRAVRDGRALEFRLEESCGLF